MYLAFVLIKKKAFFLVDLALYDFIDSHAPGLHARVYQKNFQEFSHFVTGSRDPIPVVICMWQAS